MRLLRRPLREALVKLRLWANTPEGPSFLGAMSIPLAFRAMAGWRRVVDPKATFQIRLMPAQKDAIGDGCSFEGHDR